MDGAKMYSPVFESDASQCGGVRAACACAWSNLKTSENVRDSASQFRGRCRWATERFAFGSSIQMSAVRPVELYIFTVA